MKYIISIIFLSFILTSLLFAEEKKCKELVDKPIQWSKCITNKGVDLSKKGSKKLNTDSKLTDWIKKKLEK